MLKKLRLRNYRGFKDHELPLKDLTVIVGQNNAGKTTLVEALRLLSIVVSRYRNLHYRQPPQWADLPRYRLGVSPSMQNLDINFESIPHRYDYDPAPVNIDCWFDNGSSISIYINTDREVYAVIKDRRGRIVKNKNHAHEANLPTVDIMPQIGPVRMTEKILRDDYVHAEMSSRLSSLHFRNQLRVLYNKTFSQFQQIVERSWAGVRVESLSTNESILNLFIRNEGFVGEVGLMGHGLQMWLQTMWFLTRSCDSDTVILDEPDIYMHPDLQRKLIRFIRDRFPQTILTTHSIEIMSEIAPGNILVVDKDHPRSNFATSLPAVQKITDGIGSVHNVHIARLFTSRRLLMLEGEDINILKHFQDIIFPNTNEPIQSIPQMSIGGWGGWNYVIGSSMLLENALGQNIHVYCILDRDYHTNYEINKRYREAIDKGIRLHIWSRKEIENFILSPTVIFRYISNKLPRRAKAITMDEVTSKIEEITQDMKLETCDKLANEFFVLQNKEKNRTYDVSLPNRKAREHVEKCRRDNGSILPVVSGKSLLSKLSFWSQNEVGVNINPTDLIREFKKEEIHQEMVSVISAIEKASEFQRPTCF